MKQILPIDNLTGHSIDQWNIHSGKFVPSVKHDSSQRIDGDEFFAIEVFTTTGSGTTKLEMPSNHFMLKPNYKNSKFKYKRTNKCLNLIEQNFHPGGNNPAPGLAFCPRFLEKIDGINYNMCYNELFNKEIINSYPPLVDIPGSKVAQFEHTVYINEDKKIVLSHGDDY